MCLYSTLLEHGAETTFIHFYMQMWSICNMPYSNYTYRNLVIT